MQDTMKQRLRSVNYIGMAAVTVVLAGAVGLGIVPMVKKGNDSIREARDLKAKLAGYDGLSQTMMQVDRQRIDTEANLVEVEKRLPSALEPDRFTDELTDVANKAGIRFESMSPKGPVQDVDGYKAQTFMIQGTGDWDACYRFLTGIRGMNRLTRLDSVTLEVADKDLKTQSNDHPVCVISVNCSTFFMER